MTTKAGTGSSTHRHYKAAATRAVKDAFSAAGTDRADLVIAFASVAYPQEPLLATLRQLTHNAPLMGGSACGVIAAGDIIEENFFLSVMVIQSSEIRFSTAAATGLQHDPEATGQALASALSSTIDDDTKCLVSFADALTLNFTRFEQGLRQGLGRERPLPLFGGATGDDWKFVKTYQYHNDEVLSDAAVAFTISGEATLAHAVNHGCVVIGEKLTITRAEGNTIYEVDGEPALTVVNRYLNEDEQRDWGKVLNSVTLGFKADDDEDALFIRYMPTKDDATGTVTIPTEVDAGTQFWITRRDPQLISAGVTAIGEEVAKQLAGREPKFVLHFDCAGRGKVIFRDQEKQDLLHSLQQQVGPDAPWAGFYTYGEFGPLRETNCFHSYTLILLAVV
ncbi:MAG: FIST C-terminal domain-containing protein [Gammaproteobacteria bacterium]|nr:FIST C-terminal domain-containing protein [Gammaproteobacteria bacterium]